MVFSRLGALKESISEVRRQSTVYIEPCEQHQEWPAVFTSETSVHFYDAGDFTKRHLTVTETCSPCSSCILYYLHEALYNLFIFPCNFLSIPDISLFE